jgi:hypothetical protein
MMRRTVAVATSLLVPLLLSLSAPCADAAEAPSKGADAVCGKVNGLNLTAAPATKLCEAGKASAISGAGPWTWSCNGTKTSVSVGCMARQAPKLCAVGINAAQCPATAGASWTPPFLPFRTVYYHTVQGSFWAQLADDAGPSPTPRELAIASIRQNFAAIKALGLDTVTFSLNDSDGWPSGHGGGFSYDPRNPASARPQFAVAQEIALRIADANHLKVIFSIGFNPYRFSSDGRADWAGLADEYGSTSNPRGAYDYVHCLMDPNLYYGEQQTTKLATIGLADGPTHSLIDDPRIIGWELYAEWNRWVVNTETGVGTQQRGFQKYWNFFYTLVHDHGAQNAFAGTYLIGSPDSVNAASRQLDSIKAFKQWFKPGSGIIQPDLIGLEFYGGSVASGYDLGSLPKDLNKMIDAMESSDPAATGDFAIPASKLYLGEGNANQVGKPGINQYFQDIFQVLADRGLSGVKFFVSDSLADKVSGGTPTLTPALPVYDLFSTAYIAAGSTKYPRGLQPGIAWHWGPKSGGSYADPTTYRSSEDISDSSYGQWTYLHPTPLGVWIQQAIFDHSNGRNLRFYANPNPAPPSGHSTLYWDLTHMPSVRNIAVHVGSASGALLANGPIASNIGGLPVVMPASGSEDFVLVDTSSIDRRVLGTVTLVAQ